MKTPLEFEQQIRRDIASCHEEIAWWKDKVARGILSPEHAAGYINREERILRIKTHVLVFARQS